MANADPMPNYGGLTSSLFVLVLKVAPPEPIYMGRTPSGSFEKEESHVLQTLRRRLQGEREGGFTLIELMVVVLIIAILIAIAIPTFLGARTRAQDRAAQSNLRNALTAEKAYYTDNQAYSSDVTATGALKTIEPSLTWAASAAPSVAGSVYVGTATSAGGTANDTVYLGAKSASGSCFYIKDQATKGTSTTPGTFYGKVVTGACVVPASATYTSSW
jgi:type IV pilus assembly protein PilA